MVQIVTWPYCLLSPHQYAVNLVPFSRTGGRSLGGIQRSVRTDRGYWRIDYINILMRAKNREQWQWWEAISESLGGTSGLVIVPVPASLLAPYASGQFEKTILVPHSDGSPFNDGSLYSQSPVQIVVEKAAEIGDTKIKVRVVNARPSLFGIRFSYENALYKTGFGDDPVNGVWDLPISPMIRAPIPAGELLNTTKPTCLCHLNDDRGMDLSYDRISMGAAPSVSFVEATDYWSDLAAGLL